MKNAVKNDSLNKSRGGFTSRGFILAAAGSAIGLGNIWRFPYMAGTNGGAAFVLVYVIAMAVIGVSLLLVEFNIGRHGRANAIDSYSKISSKFKFIGYIGFFSAPIFLSYYSVLSGWTVYYTLKSAAGLTHVPAAGLGDFFFGFVSSTWPPLLFHLLFSAMTIYIIAKGVSNGIERWSKILMPVLFILILALVARSLTLSGAADGLRWFLAPDFSKITWKVVIAAIGQIFFSLSVGMSGMLTYASYLNGDENLVKTAGVVSFFDMLVALLAGLMIFPAVFTYGMEPTSGVGLIFITLPAVFSAMPLGSLFSVAFFALLVVANLTSSISILEMPVAYLIERKKISRPKAAIIVGGLGFLLGVAVSLGYGAWSFISINEMSILDIFDYLGSNIILPLCGLLSAVVVGWFWREGAIQEVTNNYTINTWVAPVWHGIVKFVVPALLVLVFLSLIKVIG